MAISLQQTWGKARERFHRMNSREQLLSVGVVFAFAYFLFDSVWFASQTERMAAIDQQKSQQTAKVRAMEAEIQNTGKRIQDVKQREDAQAANAKLTREVAMLDKQLDAIQSQMVSLGDLVTGMLSAQHPGVTVVSLRTVPPRSLVDMKAPEKADGVTRTSAQVIREASLGAKQAAKDALGNAANQAAGAAAGALGGEAAMGSVYRHSVDVELQGAYPDLMSYVQDLTETSPQMLWSNVQLRVVKYPVSSLRMTLTLLSTQATAGLE